jgi:hypothetical protein
MDLERVSIPPTVWSDRTPVERVGRVPYQCRLIRARMARVPAATCMWRLREAEPRGCEDFLSTSARRRPNSRSPFYRSRRSGQAPARAQRSTCGG